MRTIPLPIIAPIPIDQARPGVQKLVDLLVHTLNLAMTLDKEIGEFSVSSDDINGRIAEVKEDQNKVTYHMLTMDDPVPDITAIFATLVKRIQDFVVRVDPNMAEMAAMAADHMVATVSLIYASIVEDYLERTGFSLRVKDGEFFNG